MSGFVETKYAVEFSPSAAKTYKCVETYLLCIFCAYLFTRTNNPGVLVYNQDSSTLLQQALAKDNGKNPPPLLSKDGKTHCPEMPQKGCQVDFIFGGQYQILSEFIYPLLNPICRPSMSIIQYGKSSSCKHEILHLLLGLFSVHFFRRRMISGMSSSIKCCLNSDSGPDPPSHVACSAMWNIITLIIFFLRMSEGC